MAELYGFSEYDPVFLRMVMGIRLKQPAVPPAGPCGLHHQCFDNRA